MEKVVTRTAEISLIEDGIIKVKYHADADVDIKDMQMNIDESMKLTGGKSHTALLDARGFVTMSEKALKYGATEEMLMYRTATALLTDSLAVRLTGNFFNIFLKPKLKSKIFTNEKDAIQWLRDIT